MRGLPRRLGDAFFAFCQPRQLTASSTLYFPGHALRSQRPLAQLRFPYSVRHVSRNRICNQKYSLLTFLPLTLYYQFNYFFNFFYLVVGLSQLCPQFVIGPLFTYLAPLAFVVLMSIGKEAVDDYKRYCRDQELNSQLYEAVVIAEDMAVTSIKAADIQVGDVIRLHAGQRVPADCLLLQTCNIEGTCFVRTDQLDGETDWKLKRALGVTHRRELRVIRETRGAIDIEAPRKELEDFVATCTIETMTATPLQEPLSAENALWTNVILTSGPVLALVIFTGDNTRAAKHRGFTESKLSAFDHDVNRISKYLCLILCFAACLLTLGKPLNPLSGVYFMRFVLLLSSIIPISLRVNFDMAKLVYSFFISRDREMPNTIVRNTNLPEELGRVDLIVSDKTGTLTQNRMKLQSLVVANKLYNTDNLDTAAVRRALAAVKGPFEELIVPGIELARMIYAMSICHSVLPAFDVDRQSTNYEASSPDEMAMVQWCSSVGFKLTARDLTQITLETAKTEIFEILETFAFSSARKRMGIIVREKATNQIIYLLKGADSALLRSLKSRPQWLLEELDDLSTSGLRTLVYSWKRLSEEQWRVFFEAYEVARNAIVGRQQKCYDVVDALLEFDMELIGLTGVEDELQVGVADCVESLIQAGIRIWMLTGDKVDTALCIATSAGLKGRMDAFVRITSENCACAADVAARLRRLGEGHASARRAPELLSVVVCVDSDVVALLAEDRELAALFVAATVACKSVLCCRCSPSQKAQVVHMLKRTRLRIAAVGDGGNDVPMIQAAHCGVGVLGREGRQASLAADFSLSEFRYLKRLLLWHGRLAQLRSTKLAGFIIHRGLVVSVIQVFFSSVFYFTPLALFQGWLQVGYATYYTMLPVFSLVLDRDVPPHVCFLFPELYRDDRRCLSSLTFGWILFTSIYQGAAIMVGALVLFDEQLINFVAIAFSALILLELLNVTTDILTWHRAMVGAELLSVLAYFLSLLLLPEYFNLAFVFTSSFWSKVTIITLIAWLPVHCYKFVHKIIDPPQYTKLVA